MSVTSLTEESPPDFRETTTGGIAITRTLIAKCTSRDDGPLAIRAHASCPVKGSSYTYGSESDSSIVCTGVSIAAKPDLTSGFAGSKVWIVSATYSNTVDSGSVGEDEEDPLDDPPVYEFSFAKYQIPALEDIDGEAIKNGADEAFDPPYLVDENRPIVTVTRNELSFSPAVAVEYQDAVNSDAFAGVDPGVAKIVGISARTATRGSVSYFVVTYEIEFRWQGWNPTRILAIGYRYRLNETGPSMNYVDPVTKQAPTTPILLQLNGLESPPVDGVRPTFWHEFTFYREKTFGLLNLGL